MAVYHADQVHRRKSKNYTLLKCNGHRLSGRSATKCACISKTENGSVEDVATCWSDAFVRRSSFGHVTDTWPPHLRRKANQIKQPVSFFQRKVTETKVNACSGHPQVGNSEAPAGEEHREGLALVPLRRRLVGGQSVYA